MRCPYLVHAIHALHLLGPALPLFMQFIIYPHACKQVRGLQLQYGWMMLTTLVLGATLLCT